MTTLSQWQRDTTLQIKANERDTKRAQRDALKLSEVPPTHLKLPGLTVNDTGLYGWNNWKFLTLVNFYTSTGMVMFSLSATIETKDLAGSLAYRVLSTGADLTNFFRFVATNQQALTVDNMFPKSSAPYAASGEYCGVHKFEPDTYSINLFYLGKTKAVPTGSEFLKISDIDLIVKDLQ